MGSCFKFSRKKNTYYFNEPYTPDESKHHSDNRAAYLKAWTLYEKGFDPNKAAANTHSHNAQTRQTVQQREEQLKERRIKETDHNNQSNSEDLYAKVNKSSDDAKKSDDKPVESKNQKEEREAPEEDEEEEVGLAVPYNPDKNLYDVAQRIVQKDETPDDVTKDLKREDSVLSYNSDYDYEQVGTGTVQAAGLYWTSLLTSIMLTLPTLNTVNINSLSYAVNCEAEV